MNSMLIKCFGMLRKFGMEMRDYPTTIKLAFA